jgi:hypothetical protein
MIVGGLLGNQLLSVLRLIPGSPLPFDQEALAALAARRLSTLRSS